KLVNALDRPPEPRRFAAHFVERREPVVNVESRVLDALGGDGRGHLLEFPREASLELMVFLRRRAAGRILQQNGVPDEVEQRLAERRVLLAGPVNGPADRGFVGSRRAAVHIRTVHREADDDLAESAADAVEGEVARSAIEAGEAVELV